MTLRVPDPPDVMHWTYPLPLKLAGAANIYTIHDLVPLRLPHTSLEDKAYYERLIGACIATSERIVTVSEASRTDIIELFNADAHKVVNSFQAIDVPERGDRSDLDRRLRRLFDLEPLGYFLFVGAIEPKKNIGRLIEAYLTAELDPPLVIVGGQGWRSEQELRLLGTSNGRMLPAAAKVRRIDYLPRPMLLDLMRGARGLLFPSLYEGFGLPAAEAMFLGVPVLVSNAGSLPELVGDAALTVDPYDVGAITDALRRLDGDGALRARLTKAGPVQVERFSMTSYCRMLDPIYKAARAGHARRPSRSMEDRNFDAQG